MFHKLLRTLLDAALPQSCALCGARSRAAVCEGCERDWPDTRSRCACCANILPSANANDRCGACLGTPPPFDATYAVCDYAAPLDMLVLQLKFGAQLALAPWIASRMHQTLRCGSAALPDLLCPVPLSRQRLVERGYNQALEVARALAGQLALPLAPCLLERRRDTAPQAATAPRQRAANVHQAFAVLDSRQVLGRHIGVVDDVMTSGHTLVQVAHALKHAGASRVTNIVFARTPPRA